MAFFDDDSDRNRRGFNQQWNDEDDRFDRNRNYGGMNDYERRRERNYGEGGYGGRGNFGIQGNRSSYSGMNEGNRGYMGYGSSDYGSSASDYNQRQQRGYYGYQGNRGDYSGMNEGNRGYGRGYGQDRDFWDKTKDEVSSWFGDEEASRRRRMDYMRGEHRGKGPRGYTRSDDRIKEDINDRLSDDSQVDASDIEVNVNNGEVTLSGTVNSRWEKRHAEDIVEDISGVKHVENRLRVSSSTGSSTTDYTNSGARTTSATSASTTNLGITGATT